MNWIRGGFRRLLPMLLAITLAASALPAETLRAVQNRIAGVLAHPELRQARVGTVVVSLDRGETICRDAGDLPLLPASNMKLVTCATALELLGGAYDCSTVPGAKPGETLSSFSSRTLKPSDNDLANALLDWLPSAAGRSDLTPRQLCSETWGERGVYLYGARWNDGSGLSRMDRLSADMVLGLLRCMDGSRWREEFIRALPVAGVDGTLRRRMVGTIAQRRVQAKTGTLTGVSALSGYARTLSGERLAFSIIMNGHTCGPERVRRMQDHVCIALVGLEREEGSR